MTKNFETDYFVIGAGAAAMAFADELLTTSDARILMVDRRDKPGGHWNDAYPFVRLHQPSAFYGVNSRELGNRTKDAVGFNKGLYNLASGAEVAGLFRSGDAATNAAFGTRSIFSDEQRDSG